MKNRKRLLAFCLAAALLLPVSVLSGARERMAEAAEATPESVPGFAERAGGCAGTYTDHLGNQIAYLYSFPLVTADTEDAAAVNAELDALYETYIAPELRNMEEGLSIVTIRALWRAAEYGGIRSLLVCLHNDWGISRYEVYPFTADGKRAGNEAIFAALGISGEDFAAAAAEKLAEYYDALWPEDGAGEDSAPIKMCRGQTLAPENCHAGLPIHVTSHGTVCFVGGVYTVAGAGYYEHLFVLAPQGGFSPEELAELACLHCGMKYGLCPKTALSEENADGSVTVRLYGREDDPDSVLGRYILSPADGTGVDLMDRVVDLTVQ